MQTHHMDPDKEKLVIDNINLVRTVIRDRFSMYTEYYDDMLQEGIIGLTRAVDKYDPNKGAQLGTFAYWCIKNEIQKFVSECTDNIKVPVSVRLAMNAAKILDEKGADSEEYHRVEKCHKLVSTKCINAGERASRISSIDAETEEGTPYLEFIPDDSPDTTYDITYETRRMFSDIHNWFNFNYPEDMFKTRVYMDYLYLKNGDYTQPSIIYDYIISRYPVNRVEIRQIIDEYKSRLTEYFSFKNILKN